MSAINHQDELSCLVDAFCNGSISAVDADRLSALLESDEAGRQYYNNCMFLHAALYAEQADPILGDSTMEAAGYEITTRPAGRDLARLSRPSSWRASFALATALCGVALGSSWLTTYFATSRGDANGAAAFRAVDPPESVPVAKITATRNCLWNESAEGIGFGTVLFAGQRLDLLAGLVEVTFFDGAQVVLEGPAALDVRDSDQAVLHAGRIAAVVPERARGFEVMAKGLNVVDLGTEFGMWAEPDGETEVHVFHGLVMAHLLDHDGQQVRTVELNTAEAARIRPESSMVAMIPARDEEFVRSLSVASGPHDGLYATESFNYPDGPLSEQNGGFGWGGPWFSVAAADVEGTTNGVESGSLDYPGLVPLGNRATQTGQQNRIRRSLSTSIGGVFDAAGLVENQDGVRLIGRQGTTVYVSFLQRVDQTDDVFYGLELHRNDGNANRVLCIGNGAEESGYGATSNYNVYGLRNFPALGEENTETNFIVVKITFGVGNRDRVQIFRNPESLVTEKACVADAELFGNFAFDRISLGNFNGTKVHEVGEIRVGTTFLAVIRRRSRGADRLMRPMAVLDPSSSRSGAGAASATVRGWSTRMSTTL